MKFSKVFISATHRAFKEKSFKEIDEYKNAKVARDKKKELEKKVFIEF